MVEPVTLSEENQAALALIRELHAMGAAKVSVGAVHVEFAADNRDHAPVDQGELLALKAENASLRELIKAYQED